MQSTSREKSLRTKLRIFCASSIGRNWVDRKIRRSVGAASAIAANPAQSERPSQADTLSIFSSLDEGRFASDRSFVIGPVACEHPKNQIQVPKVSLMPSRGAASFTPSTITMQKREYGSVIPLGFSSARRSTSSVWLKPGRKVVSALCKFGRNEGAKASAMSELGQKHHFGPRPMTSGGGARITGARRFVPGPNSGIDSVPRSMDNRSRRPVDLLAPAKRPLIDIAMSAIATPIVSLHASK